MSSKWEVSSRSAWLISGIFVLPYYDILLVACTPGLCSLIPAVSQVAVLAVTVGLLFLLPGLLAFSWPILTYLIFTANRMPNVVSGSGARIRLYKE